MFDEDAFEAANLAARTEEVRMDCLAPWYKDAEPVFKIRGLTAEENYRAQAARQRQREVGNLILAIADKQNQVEAVREALGLGKEMPGEMAMRIEMVAAGVVEPRLSLQSVRKISEAFPVEFMKLSHRITILTGMGAIDLGKPPAAS